MLVFSITLATISSFQKKFAAHPFACPPDYTFRRVALGDSVGGAMGKYEIGGYKILALLKKMQQKAIDVFANLSNTVIIVLNL